MQVQFGKTIGKVLITFGGLMLIVQLWVWSRSYQAPPSLRKQNVPEVAPASPAPTRLPLVIGCIAVIGGSVVFAYNIGRAQDRPVRPGHRV
jgi:hypothetical protein